MGFNIREFINTIESKEFLRRDAGYKAQYFATRSEELSNWHIYVSHRDRKTREMLCEALHDTEIAEIIIKVVNEGQDYDVGFDKKFVVVLRDVINTQKRIYGDKDDKILNSYENVIAKIIKKDFKTLAKVTGISRELAYELMNIVPTPNMITPTTLGLFVYRINRKLYEAEEHGEAIEKIKTVRKIYNAIFIEEYDENETKVKPITPEDVALAILLERRNPDEVISKRVYSLLTVFALDTIESCSKKEVKELMKRYAEQRIKEKPGDRRINIGASSSRDYPKITKAIRKLRDKEKYEKCFK